MIIEIQTERFMQRNNKLFDSQAKNVISIFILFDFFKKLYEKNVKLYFLF